MATTQPGGRFKVGGKLVNAKGEPTTDQRPSPFGGADSSFDIAAAKRDELEAEAKRRGITVTREDGRDDIPPTADDYRRALREHAEKSAG